MANPYINAVGVYENKLSIGNAVLERVEYEAGTVRQAQLLSGKVGLQVQGFAWTAKRPSTTTYWRRFIVFPPHGLDS